MKPLAPLPLKRVVAGRFQMLLVRLFGKRYTFSDGHYRSTFRVFRGRFYLEKMEPRPDYTDWNKVLKEAPTRRF